MSNLVSVEYAPRPRKGAMTMPSPIDGAVGETFEHYLTSKRYAKDDLIPVRFPLVAPGSYRKLLYNNRDPYDEAHFLSESVLVRKDWLHRVRRVPVSLYSEVRGKLPSELFEKPEYVRFVSRDKFFEALKALNSIYPHVVAWKREWKNERLPLFVEARIYGIDTVINTYDPRKLSGAAVQIILRPAPTEAHEKAGIKVQRCISDVILFSNSSEYVSYLDGVDIKRESMSYGKLMERYNGTLTAKQYTANKRNSKPEEAGADKKYYALPEEPKKANAQ